GLGALHGRASTRWTSRRRGSPGGGLASAEGGEEPAFGRSTPCAPGGRGPPPAGAAGLAGGPPAVPGGGVGGARGGDGRGVGGGRGVGALGGGAGKEKQETGDRQEATGNRHRIPGPWIP